MTTAEQITVIGFEPNARGKLLRAAKRNNRVVNTMTTEELIADWLNTNSEPLPDGISVDVAGATVPTLDPVIATPATAADTTPATVADPALIDENARLRSQLNAALATVPVPTDDSATCTTTHVQASDVFGADAPDIMVPVFEWTPALPSAVPVIDEHYQFRGDLLARVLLALATDQRAYFFGHTGTGKTTLIEQVAARLNWPVTRVNLDTEIGRLELLGKETLREKNGATVSNFEPGAIVTAMDHGHILLTDEIDAAAPECLFILQAIAEGRPLTLLEDNRVVQAHAMFRLMATANTNGQVDESGHYQGTKALNAAFLDRFTIWGEVKYLTQEQECELLKRHGITPTLAKDCADYGRIHREAFVQGEISLPLTLRGLITFAENSATLGRANAFAAAVLDRATTEDRAVIESLYQRALA